GRPGRRPVDLDARGLGASAPSAVFLAVLAAVFLTAVFFAAVFLAAVFLAALAGAAPASAFSPAFTASVSTSRVAATVLVFLAASSATSGETRVTLVIVAFHRRKNTGMA